MAAPADPGQKFSAPAAGGSMVACAGASMLSLGNVPPPRQESLGGGDLIPCEQNQVCTPGTCAHPPAVASPAGASGNTTTPGPSPAGATATTDGGSLLDAAGASMLSLGNVPPQRQESMGGSSNNSTG